MIKAKTKARTKGKKVSSKTSISIINARYFLDTLYESNVENIDMDEIADKQNLERFISELEALIESTTGALTLTARSS